MNTHHNNQKLTRVISKFLTDEHSCREYAPGENLRNILRFNEELQLSTCLEASVDTNYNEILSSRQWTTVEMQVRGITTTVMYPMLAGDDGKMISCPLGLDTRVDSATSRSQLTTDEVILHYRRHCGHKPFPINMEGEKHGVMPKTRIQLRQTSDFPHAQWTSPARPVSAINAMLKRLGYSALPTDKSNLMLSLIETTVKGLVATSNWTDESISTIYSSLDGYPHYDSCMSRKPAEWFEIYDVMQSADKLGLINITRGGEHIGRALVWFGSNPTAKYIDRIYAPGSRGDADADVVKSLKAFCAAEGITKSVWESSARILGLEFVSRFRTQLPLHRQLDLHRRLRLVEREG